jgi:hypothetical protein
MGYTPGCDGTDQDYINLRQDDCRVSLLVRNHGREQFVYAGELDYREHTQFVDPITGKSQLISRWMPESCVADCSTMARASWRLSAIM